MRRLFNKKALMILGTVLILIGIPLTTFVLRNQTVLKSRASNSQEPQNIKITNVTDTSFTITYQTESPSTGSISYGNDRKLGESELEDADKEKGIFSPKKIHSISVKKLTPSTKYYLTITSGSDTFLDNGSPFEITTGRNISSPSANQQITAKGRVILPDGNAPSEALVYMSTGNSQLLSATTTKDGKFSFSLKELRNEDLSSYFSVNENTVFKIFATDGSLKSTTSISLSQTDSIPNITLSNDYDFTRETSLVASKSAESPGFPSTAVPRNNSEPKITNPKENQSFADPKPQFKGISLPNEKVEIIINSEEQIVDTITADSNGNWTYKPPVNLSPGQHTITIKTRDSQGILTTVMQSFTVFAAEPSSEPTVTPTIPTQSATPTPIPPLFPSSTVSPTPILTLISIAPNQELPPTGDSRIVPITIAAIATTAVSTVLFLLSKRMPL